MCGCKMHSAYLTKPCGHKYKIRYPETEFINMNFQYNQNQRTNHANFFARQNYESGKNILLNRLAHINNKIEKSWLDQSLNTFKIKCKALFLQNL